VKFEAIIFDLDGTIIDTSHIWHTATKQLLITKGAAYSDQLHDELNKSIHGLALDKVCALIKDQFQWNESLEQIIAEKKRIADNLYREKITFIPGFLEFYDSLHTYGLKKAVATNADTETVLLVNQAVELDKYFGSHVYNIAHVNNICKPDPAVYIYAAKQLDVDPRNCLVIEDSAHGIRAAQAAGMFCIGINTSHSYTQVQHAHKIVNTYQEIVLADLLDKI
jgi:beta-phosphoglucomutase